MIVTAAGILVALITIFGIKISKSENKAWAYPLTLSLYPIFYLGFAIHAGDMEVLAKEVVYALPFFAICLIASLKNIKNSGYILGSGYIAHGIYDAVHERIFHNPGMPDWWPIFCGVIDVAIGLYIFYLVRNVPGSSIVRE